MTADGLPSSVVRQQGDNSEFCGIAVFPNAQAVNAALRGLIELARTSARLSP